MLPGKKSKYCKQAIGTFTPLPFIQANDCRKSGPAVTLGGPQNRKRALFLLWCKRSNRTAYCCKVPFQESGDARE